MKIIDISNRLRDFEEHLKLNRQTIVSAKFGDGKTYFLKQYIEQHKEDTFFIVLHPVNYVVSSNEDIFEYIKRDILCSLVHRTEFKETKWVDIFKGIWKSNSILESVETIAEYVPYGKIATVPFRFLEKVNNEYSVNKFFDRFTEKPGSLFEMDQFSVAIQHTIHKIQEGTTQENGKKKGKKCVLIIEDLDRIDPGHLFRILNVLGAHVGDDKNTNKFGFDNIVAVLDYDTTEHIFHHFYGAQANYKGYMSKFMSSYPFRYSITEVAHEQLREYLKNECHVELLDDFPKDINGRSLLETLNNLSVREIVQILDGIDMQIDPTDVELPNGFCTYSNDYITRFFSVLVRIGYKVIKQFLVNYYLEDIIHFAQLNNYLLATGIYHNVVFDFNKKWRGYSVRHDGDYKFILRIPVSDGTINNTPISEVILKALNTAIDKVKDGKQILVV